MDNFHRNMRRIQKTYERNLRRIPIPQMTELNTTRLGFMCDCILDCLFCFYDCIVLVLRSIGPYAKSTVLFVYNRGILGVINRFIENKQE